MRHQANARFWSLYEELPHQVRRLADKSFTLLKDDPRHPSLHFKRVGRLWSVRIGGRHRALAVEEDGTFAWFWIGDHAEYERIIAGR